MDISRLPGLVAQEHLLDVPEAQFDLVLGTREAPDGGLHVQFVFPEDRFLPDTMARFAQAYAAILQALADNPRVWRKTAFIINYDEKTSFTKRTGRKPEEYVKRVLDGGKIVLRKIMDELKNDAALAYRINENTILLKVA